LRACQIKRLAYSSPDRELRQRVDDVVPLLDLRDISREETEEREEGEDKVCQSVLADFMLYRRANDSTEVVKLLHLSMTLLV
jgi:hypothetical protein